MPKARSERSKEFASSLVLATTLGISGFDDSLRWRAAGRLEAGQSQAEVARLLQGPQKVVSRLWNQFQTSGIATRKICHGRTRTMTSAQDRYLALSARRHRWTTVPQLARDLSAVSGRIISRQTVYSRLTEVALTLGVQTPFDCIQ
ncbi:HTH_Tnp_Tc3_2 domain-containing protein [Trichonephila clavipes]|uniref:HTH_Tnp_Tc3_2 domain-containing protein n=1 Tax=Trichonephila clavipes TaxID=2585209 RepID=A0A8X6V764_TRICX|nr:HTH_Tnp_Tc3_2 domain-containing protein [Trichonephila clavipes]